MANNSAFGGQAAIESCSCTDLSAHRQVVHSNCGSSRTTARSLQGQAAIELPSGATARSLKAQAAMEYLVTYGWALLALFVVVGYLFSTGAFSANNFAAQECVFQPDLPCSPYVIYKESATVTHLKFNLTNGLGFPIKIKSINYTATSMGMAGKHTYSPIVAASPTPILSGDKFGFDFSFSGDTQPSEREFKTVQVTLEYLNCRNAASCSGPYVTSGRISSIVEKKA